MKFKQNSILFWEINITMFIFAVLSIVIVIIYGKSSIGIGIFLAILFLGVAVFHSFLERKFITINENGIACQKGEKVLWQYKWAEIQKLKKSNRFRNPSVEIILKNQQEPYGETDYYFQLGFKAKKAVKMYCPFKIIK